MTPTTMKRIAAELGVSITTVSKVLNHRADIGTETRARVLAKVEELGTGPTRSPGASRSAARTPLASSFRT